MTYGDATNPGHITPLLEAEPDQIILCLTPDNRTPAAYRNTYLLAAQQLASTAQRLAPDSHLIMVSSTSLYAQNNGESVNEASACQPQTGTAQILLAAEQAIAKSHNPFSIVRFSGIYGPGRRRLLDRVKTGKLSPLNLPHWTNRIHSKDCAAVLEHLIQHPQWSKNGAGVLLASDCKPALNTEVETWLAEQMGVARETAPEKINPPTGKRCSNQRLLESGFQFQYPSYREGYQAMMASDRNT